MSARSSPCEAGSDVRSAQTGAFEQQMTVCRPGPSTPNLILASFRRRKESFALSTVGGTVCSLPEPKRWRRARFRGPFSPWAAQAVPG
jgi:hypothetical protein